MDYCTFFPEGWWAECCRLHDIDYTGSKDRLQADIDLFTCICSSGDWGWQTLSLIIAGVVFIGVRLFGRFFYKGVK